MKPREIVMITLWVIAVFVMTEFIVNHIMLYGTFQRFVMRICFQIQLLALVYLFFNSRDNSRRLRLLEIHFARGKRIRVKMPYSRGRIEK